MDTAQLAHRGTTPPDDDYAASVNHELRTAIAIILGYTEILQSLEAGPLTDSQRTMLEKIDGNACHLLAMTQRILHC